MINSQFFRNIAVVAGGTAGAQAVTLAFTPVITRLYSPEYFGMLGSFLAIYSAIMPVVALTYPMALVLPKTERNAASLFKLCVLITLLSFLFFQLGVMSFSLPEHSEASAFVYYLPVAVLCGGILQTLQQWLVRNRKFKFTAQVALFQSFFVNGLKCVAGVVEPSGRVLIIATIIGTAVHSTILLFGTVRKRLLKVDAQHLKWAALFGVARQYQDFPKYRAPQTLINGLSHAVPVVLLGYFYGSASVGYYLLARTTMLAPLSLVSKSVGDVFYPKVRDAYYEEKLLSPMIIKLTMALLFIAILLFSVVIFFGPTLFSIVFGAEWIKSGEYAQWLAVWFVFGFANVASNVSLPVLGLLKFNLYYEIAGLILRCGFFILAYVCLNNDVYAIAAFSVAGVVMNCVLILFVTQKSRNHDKHTKASRSGI